MKVAFDGVCFGDGPITGVGRAFLTALAAYGEAFPGEGVLLVPDGATAPVVAGVAPVTAPRGALRRQLALPWLLRRLGADVLHSSVAAVPLAAPCPTIATVHDVPWLHPEAGERTSLRRRMAVRAALRSAAAVIAPSTFTRDDAHTLLGHATTLHLIPHGIPMPAATAVARDGPFLVLGDDRPRKNRTRVAAAHALAAARSDTLPALCFAGPPDAYVDEAAKARLLRTCRAVVQCSLFEGFGMPVLEAMAHGAPLVCADIPPFRELAAGVARFVDPRNPAAIAEALLQVAATTPADAGVLAGVARARTFAATTTAAKWRALHEALVRR